VTPWYWESALPVGNVIVIVIIVLCNVFQIFFERSEPLHSRYDVCDIAKLESRSNLFE
jgi:hypothetical protein